VLVYVIVYTYLNVCTSHNNKPFIYSLVDIVFLTNAYFIVCQSVIRWVCNYS